MGFLTGFTGGATLCLSIAYLTLLNHQRNRRMQSEMVRSQTQLLHSLTLDASPRVDSTLSGPSPPPPPSRLELAARERVDLVEAVKDRWNSEVANTVRWAQNKDWTAQWETVEDAARRLLGLPPVPESVQEVARATTSEMGKPAVDKSSSSVRLAGEKAEVKAASVSMESSPVSDLEKALRQRYETKDVLEQSVEDALGERYLPMAQRDKAKLRGI